MDDDRSTVEITTKEYEELIKDQYLLICLQSAGVDNWDGYDEAIINFEEYEE